MTITILAATGAACALFFTIRRHRRQIRAALRGQPTLKTRLRPER